MSKDTFFLREFFNIVVNLLVIGVLSAFSILFIFLLSFSLLSLSLFSVFNGVFCVSSRKLWLNTGNFSTKEFNKLLLSFLSASFCSFNNVSISWRPVFPCPIYWSFIDEFFIACLWYLYNCFEWFNVIFLIFIGRILFLSLYFFLRFNLTKFPDWTFGFDSLNVFFSFELISLLSFELSDSSLLSFIKELITLWTTDLPWRILFVDAFFFLLWFKALFIFFLLLFINSSSSSLLNSFLLSSVFILFILLLFFIFVLLLFSSNLKVLSIIYCPIGL